MDEEFTRIFDLYNKDVYRLIYSFTLNRTESKDILQETFLKLYKNLGNFPKDDFQIKKWLMRVAANQSKDFLKSYWNSRIKPTDDVDISLSESERQTFDVMSKISKKYRKTIYLYYFEGYSISEIAYILSLSESAIKHQLSRAREKIKKEMER